MGGASGQGPPGGGVSEQEKQNASGTSGRSFLSPAVEDARDNVLYQTITFEGLLSEFLRPEVRTAFLRGYMGVHGNSNAVLESVDCIRDVMLPAPSRGNAAMKRDRAIAGVKFFSAFLARSEERPLDVNGEALPDPRTFSEWFSFFAEVSQSQYWRVSRLDEVSVRTRPATTVAGPGDSGELPLMMGELNLRSSPKLDRKQGRVDLPRAATLVESNCETGSYRDQQCTRMTQSNLPDRASGDFLETKFNPCKDDGATHRLHRGNQRDRQICQRSSSMRRTSSESEETETHSSSADSSDYYRRRGRGGNRSRYRKDVVPPGTFDGLGAVSLRRFLSDFEEYFRAKYDGSSRQQAKHLRDFLGGQVREAFDAIDGTNMGYSSLKKKLMKWYSNERVSSRRQAETDFERAQIKPKESLTIFVLRLERMAERAFPGSVGERGRHLSRKIWSCAPEPFIKVMTESQRGLALSSRKGRLTWSVIKRLAEAEDRCNRMQNERRDQQDSENVLDVWYSRPRKREDLEQVRGVRSAGTSEAHGASSRSPNPGAYALGGRVSVDVRPVCNWCGRKGHKENNCWERSGLCTLCGSDEHQKEDCQRFEDQHPAFRPECPLCGGSHLGKYCTKHSLN